MARRIFNIDLDAFFVSVEQVLNPELKGKALSRQSRVQRILVSEASWSTL
jgi:nucleotidyltransferase/DNA polymerase involved in DNA repair